MRVVERNGMRGLTIRATAAEAGVTHGLVRHHFGSRAALLEATLEHAVSITVDAINFESNSDDPGDIAHDLSATIESTVELCAFQFEIMLESRRQPSMLPQIRAMMSSYELATQRALERVGLGDDPEVARVVFAAMDGLALQQITFGEPERTDAGVHILSTLIEALATVRANRSLATAKSVRDSDTSAARSRRARPGTRRSAEHS
jgi:AcrR family transcriptional regulator